MISLSIRSRSFSLLVESYSGALKERASRNAPRFPHPPRVAGVRQDPVSLRPRSLPLSVEQIERYRRRRSTSAGLPLARARWFFKQRRSAHELSARSLRFAHLDGCRRAECSSAGAPPQTAHRTQITLRRPAGYRRETSPPCRPPATFVQPRSHHSQTLPLRPPETAAFPGPAAAAPVQSQHPARKVALVSARARLLAAAPRGFSFPPSNDAPSRRGGETCAEGCGQAPDRPKQPLAGERRTRRPPAARFFRPTNVHGLIGAKNQTTPPERHTGHSSHRARGPQSGAAQTRRARLELWRESTCAEFRVHAPP